MGDSQGWTVLIRLGMAFLWALVSAGVFYVLFRMGRKLWRRVRDIFGATMSQRLIGFGIASLLFPQAAIGMLGLLIYAFITLTVLTPVDLLLGTMEVGGGDKSSWGPILERAAQIIARNLDFVARRFLGQAPAPGSPELPLLSGSRLELGDLLALLVCWALIGVLLQPKEGAEGRSRISSFYVGLQPSSRKNLLLAAILMLGGFLSLAAIIAIPFLSEAAPEEVPTRASLEEQLDKRSLGEKVFLAPLKDPFTEIDQLLQDKSKLPPELHASLESTVTEQRQRWTQLQRSVEAWRSEAPEFLKNAKDRALSKYEHSTLSRLGSRETLQHYDRLISWYEETQDDLEKTISYCSGWLPLLQSQWESWSSEVTSRITSRSDSPDRLVIPSPPDEALHHIVLARCEMGSLRLAPAPNRPSVGESLGPIGLIVRWLLRAESMPLALISGMLGFGLFGSAISRFVRTHMDQKKEGEPLVADLGRIVLTGASAAVVVFLSVQGGLAAFSGTKDAPEPNPYSLLLTCFIAAIFSERIWEWARNRLQQSFSSGSHGNGSSGKPPPEASPERVAPQEGSEPLPPAPPRTETPQQPTHPP